MYVSGLYRDNGKENGNYYSLLGHIQGYNGKENGNYYIEHFPRVAWKPIQRPFARIVKP